jgi:hypothetical protein
MVIAINGDSYLIEAQISNDSSMAVRIFQYIMNEGRKQGGAGEGGGVRRRLPRARVIYWEDTAGTPEQEYIEFVFPGGEKHLYEIPSVKFSRYGVRELEEEGLGLLLPFCVVKGRRGLKRAKEEERKEAAKEAEDAAREAVEAMGRLRGRGELNGYDMENMMMLTKVLWEELYRPYTEFAMEEGKMWEHIKLLDYDAVIRERDEAKRRADEATWQRDEAKRRADEAARKLLAMGVSREQLENVGLLE